MFIAVWFPIYFFILKSPQEDPFLQGGGELGPNTFGDLSLPENWVVR